MGRVLSLPLSIPLREMPILSEFRLSAYLSLLLSLPFGVGWWMMGEQAGVAGYYTRIKAELNMRIILNMEAYIMIMRNILNMEAYIMIMRNILNKDRIDASSTNHLGRCELILLRYIKSIDSRIETPYPALATFENENHSHFFFFPRWGGLSLHNPESSP